MQRQQKAKSRCIVLHPNVMDVSYSMHFPDFVTILADRAIAHKFIHNLILACTRHFEIFLALHNLSSPMVFPYATIFHAMKNFHSEFHTTWINMDECPRQDRVCTQMSALSCFNYFFWFARNTQDEKYFGVFFLHEVLCYLQCCNFSWFVYCF